MWPQTSSHRLWQKERIVKIVSEDLRDLETVKDVSLILLLAEILPSKVGSPLSLRSFIKCICGIENMVASQLLKYCHYLEDIEGYKMELKYLRDIDGREIDFVVLKNNKPEFKDFSSATTGRELPFITFCKEKRMP